MRVKSASQRMGVLIDNLLQLSRLTRVEMQLETTNLSDMAESIANELKDSFPERKASFIIQKDMIANADRNLIQIALQNLFGNAWKYTKQEADTKIEFGTLIKDQQTVYFIRDNGVGFDMKYVDKLFGAFQRLHNISEFEGTGIGLATVQRIINRHQGTIWTEAEVNKGASFFFTL
jgi:light-regulated signal transduction histidine kinase (bacteriophytochrome)